MIGSVLGSIVENGGEEEPNSDTPLIETDNGATDPLGGALGLIHWSQGGDQTDPETGDDTTGDEETELGSRGL